MRFQKFLKSFVFVLNHQKQFKRNFRPFLKINNKRNLISNKHFYSTKNPISNFKIEKSTAIEASQKSNVPVSTFVLLKQKGR